MLNIIESLISYYVYSFGKDACYEGDLVRRVSIIKEKLVIY